MRGPSRYQTLLTTEADRQTLFTAGQAYESATREATLNGGPPRLDLLLRPQSVIRKRTEAVRSLCMPVKSSLVYAEWRLVTAALAAARISIAQAARRISQCKP